MSLQAGINVFSIHQELGEDYFGALQSLAEAGYKNLELIGFNMKSFSRFIDEIPAAQLKSKLKELGMKAVSAHEGTRPGADLSAHDWDTVMSYYDQLGCHNIVLPSVWIKDREETLRIAEQMNVVGKKLKASGFQFYLHNHAHEFKREGGSTLFDLIVANTDPAYVKFELDLVWVMRAGLEPLTVLQQLGARCDLIHQKDISNSTAYGLNILEAAEQAEQQVEGFQLYQTYSQPSDYVDLGEGIFDFGMYEEIKRLGHVQYTFVENEGNPPNKLQSVSSDLTFIEKLL